MKVTSNINASKETWFIEKDDKENALPKGYIIAHATLTNPEKFVSDYGSKVADVVEKYDGQFLVRGGNVSYREGDPTDLNVVVEFPSLREGDGLHQQPRIQSNRGRA